MDAASGDAPAGDRGVVGETAGFEIGDGNGTPQGNGRPDGSAPKGRHRYGPVELLRLALAAMTDPELTRADVATLAALLQHVHRDRGDAWPSLDKLTEMAGSKTRSTTVKALARLEKGKYI